MYLGTLPEVIHEGVKPSIKKKRRRGTIADINRNLNPFLDPKHRATDNQWTGSATGFIGGAYLGGPVGAVVGSGVGYLTGSIADGIKGTRNER